MRLFLFIIFFYCSFISIGQRIDFKNDSLFVNNYFVNWTTSKSTLDSLLKVDGKEKKRIGKYKPGTKEPYKWTSYSYDKLGLIFGKNDYDTISLTLAVKLNRNSNPTVDANNMSTRIFKGKFFIDDILMNDIKNIDQLQKLKKFSLTGNIVYNLIYKKRQIRVLTDFQTGELTCIFIY